MTGRGKVGRRAQAGAIGLTDVLLGLAVTAIALPAVVGITGQQTREIQDQVAAQQLKALGEATRGYVRDHFAQIYGAIFNGDPGGDYLDISQLAATGYLPANFSLTNAFRQKMVVLLRIVADTGAGCTRPDLSQMPDGIHCKRLLEAVGVTTGGQKLDPARAAHIAVSAGANAGIVADAGTVRGSYGGWCEDLSLFGGSSSASCPRDARPSRSTALAAVGGSYGAPAQGGLSFAMFFNGNDLMSDYLNRFDTGNLEDNTMHTAIAMDAHDVTDVKTVQISGVSQGLEAARMNMINDLYDGRYTGNPTTPGVLSAQSFTATGNVTAAAVYAGNFFHSSDASLKTNIGPIDDPLALVGELKGHRFQWKADGSRDLGFVAQEVQAVLPEAVGHTAEGKLSVKYDVMAAPLVEAVKTLSHRLGALERKLPQAPEGREPESAP